MKTMLTFLAATFVLGFGAPLVAEEQANSPSGFSNVTGSAGSEGKTGESAERPIKKTIDGKTICFQNDPALTKPQGGH
jgi:hypothetical protein